MTREIVVDETLSFAHRVGEDVKVSVRVPAADLPSDGAAVRLQSVRRSFRVAADVEVDGDAATVTFRAPSAKLRQATWSLEIRGPGGVPVIPVQARLLARQDQPVALLPGPQPRTHLPAPAPRRKRPPLVRRAARRLPAPVKTALRRGRAAVSRPRT